MHFEYTLKVQLATGMTSFKKSVQTNICQSVFIHSGKDNFKELVAKK